MSVSPQEAELPEYPKDHLRFITCGSVDDGKSTLIGRLLYDAGAVLDDQIETLERDSKKFGTTGGGLDFALLVDGLSAEREQGITIDVAYRYFSTAKRAFIVADTPGHEQYTRNMATGASDAELAVILVDARKGILPQTRRHALIASLFGIRHIVLAVNKMDLVNGSEETFRRIAEDYEDFARELPSAMIQAIPLSALRGDNVVRRGVRFPWYDGPSLVEYLETVEVRRELDACPFRLPVQWVNRPNADFRGYAGTIASGALRVGDGVVVLPSGLRSSVHAILAPGGERMSAVAGEAVTVRLADEIDISRGDVLAAAGDPPQMANQFVARLLWMHESPLLPNRDYLIKIGTRFVPATVTEIKYKTDVSTLQRLAAKVLAMNEIASVNLSTREPIAFDPFAENRTTGAFIVVDRLTNDTAGVGMIEFALKRATNIHWQAIDITRTLRAELKGQRPAVLWFTGLSGSGKSTLANLVERRLFALGRHTYILDGDNVRHGLNRDLGFTQADRVENVRRVAETAKLFADAGLIVLCSFISPFRAERRMAREIMPPGEFIEIFVDAPLDVAEARDPKGLYRKARRGELKNFTGIDSPYEAPETPELRLQTSEEEAAKLADDVIEHLRAHGFLSRN